MVSAFGLAYHQACGNLQGLNDGVLAKRMGPGFSCRNGTAAVLMAMRGITGARNVLQGRNGLFNVYHRGDYSPEVLLSELGRRFEVTNLSYKPYPCCRENHPSIDAALALKKEHRLQANEIEEVVANLSKATKELLCEPLEVKRNPVSTVDAQFSVPWTVSSALVKGKVGIDTFTETAIRDASVLDLTKRVTPRIDPALERMGVAPARLEIRMKDGRTVVRQVDHAFGSPENPMDMNATVAKFTDCAAHAFKPFSEEHLQKLLQMLLHMEDVEDVGMIARLLSIRDAERGN
jgi:2-methylcitrate dehydratase PrpD